MRASFLRIRHQNGGGFGGELAFGDPEQLENPGLIDQAHFDVHCGAGAGCDRPTVVGQVVTSLGQIACGVVDGLVVHDRQLFGALEYGGGVDRLAGCPCGLGGQIVRTHQRP
jgi:hypothetical protein